MTIQRYDWSSEVQPANAHARSSLPGTNSGHGHAWPRPDGIKARCGGVGLCKICSADALLVKVSISEPAQPEPVAAEMPEAVSVNTWQLEELLKYADLAEVSLRTGFHPPEFLFEPADRSLRQCIDAIKEQRDQWRTHSAQPAKVRMTKELRRALDAAEAQAGWHMDQGRPKTFDEIDAAIAAVRAQAAEAGKVRMPKVRIALDTMRAHFEPNCQGQCRFPMVWEFCIAALAELDAAEGRK